ncbi:MAG: tetratricopeptide repeat protein [Oscillatoria sp. SIO1A7]|nr:tetratricopeptide repeat protein [Oscillatoria sp. SIO1A7]
MDYYRFFEQLPKLYENWGQDSVRPKSEKFQTALDQIQGMTTANVMQLLNFAVECMEPDEIYCEVGTYRGSTLIGALLDRPGSMAYAVDNFSEFDVGGENIEKLWENLQKFNLAEKVYFCEQDFEEFFLDLRQIETEDKFGVYLYDGAHDYRSQLLGLLLAKSFLADRALIIVDDANWERVRQANWDFAAAHPECKVELDLLTPRRGYPTFLNGIQVLSWDVTRGYNYSTETFRDKRQQKVIQELYNLQFPPNEDLIDTYNKLGYLLLKEGKLERAEAIYREAIASNPDRFGSYLNLGNVLLQQNKLESAMTAYKTALALSPGNADVLHNLEIARKIPQNPALI